VSLGAVPPEAVEAARWLAWRALQIDRRELAEDLLAGCAALQPEHRETHVLRARLALGRGDAIVAHQAAAQAWSLGQDAEVALLVGRALLLRRERAEAAKWLAEAPRIAPAGTRVSKLARLLRARVR